MYEDRKAYLRDVAHNVAVCRNKLDSILKAIGWTHSSLQVQAFGELGSKTDTSDEDPSGVKDGNISNQEQTPSDEPRKSNHLLSTTDISFETDILFFLCFLIYFIVLV